MANRRDRDRPPIPQDAPPVDSRDAVCSADFLKELERRSAAFRDGSTKARPAADALADLRRRQAGEATVRQGVAEEARGQLFADPQHQTIAGICGSGSLHLFRYLRKNEVDTQSE